MAEFIDRLNTPANTDGDHGFQGVNSYLEPRVLPAGLVQDAQDFRMEGNRAKVRNGWDFLAGLTGISPGYTYDAGNEQVFAGGLYSDPDDGNKDWLVAVTKKKAIIYNADTTYYVNYHSDTATADAGTDKFTFSGAHSFQVGDAVQVTNGGTLPTGISEDTTYYVIDTDSDKVQLASTYPNALAGTQIDLTGSPSGSHTIQSIVDTSMDPMVVQAFNKVYIMRYKQRPLVWDGNTAATGDVVTSEFSSLDSAASGGGDPFPSTKTAIYYSNRLIGIQPEDIATPTQSVTGAQTVVMTDLLTENNVTPVDGNGGGEFYMNQGAADWTIGFATYQEFQLVVLNRRSIHMILNTHATSIAERQTIDDRYGCIARKSIAQGGGYIFFLSDEGVFTLSTARDATTGMGLTISKVQGASLPLSQSIEDQISTINYASDAVYNSCSAVFDNRYYLAVPTGNDTENLTVFIYDMLNQAWVSKDTYPEGIIDFVVMPHSGAYRLFAVANTGWYLMEENTGADDSGREIGSDSESDTTAITAKLKTRDYHGASSLVKKFPQIRVGADVSNGDAFTIKLNTTDPDRTTTLKSVTASGTEDTVYKLRSRVRGHTANVEIDVTAGSPQFRWIEVKALPFGGLSNQTVE